MHFQTQLLLPEGIYDALQTCGLISASLIGSALYAQDPNDIDVALIIEGQPTMAAIRTSLRDTIRETVLVERVAKYTKQRDTSVCRLHFIVFSNHESREVHRFRVLDGMPLWKRTA